ncbi:MAG: hypothetical protein LBR98_10070 [Syntrophomonadaceae bacterium]|nr:hypothetical protein [Syntrophomonadaceae bacterium]
MLAAQRALEEAKRRDLNKLNESRAEHEESQYYNELIEQEDITELNESWAEHEESPLDTDIR